MGRRKGEPTPSAVLSGEDVLLSLSVALQLAGVVCARCANQKSAFVVENLLDLQWVRAAVHSTDFLGFPFFPKSFG